MIAKEKTHLTGGFYFGAPGRIRRCFYKKDIGCSAGDAAFAAYTNLGPNLL